MEWEGAAFPLIMEAAEMESPSSLEEEKLPCIFNDAQQCIALLSQCQELKEKEVVAGKQTVDSRATGRRCFQKGN